MAAYTNGGWIPCTRARRQALVMRNLRCFVLQVVRCALENAASVAKTFLTSDVVVTVIPEPEPAGAGAGMDAY